MLAGLGASSPNGNQFALTDSPSKLPNLNTSGKTQTTPALTPGEKTGLFVIFGDSLTCNTAPTPFTPSSTKAEQINIYDGTSWRMKDPLLGIDSAGGCIQGRLAQNLINQGTFQRLLFIPCGVSGTATRDWIPAGEYDHRLRVALERARQITKPIDGLIMSLGTGDASLGLAASWAANFQQIRATIRAYTSARIFISKTTWQGSTNNATIRAAMDAAVDAADSVQLGSDLDPPVIPLAERDATLVHWNDSGAAHVAALYAALLGNIF
jgi:hypothetical protein